jgi:prophage maintenance system killer protein
MSTGTSALPSTAATFLLINGLRLRASEVEAYDIFPGVVAGRVSEEDLAA